MQKYYILSLLLTFSITKNLYSHDTMQNKIETNLVDLETFIPHIILDIKYATSDNFTGTKVYSKAKCYLVKEAAESLKKAAEKFEALGYKIKVFDGYRPRKIQYKFWDLVKDKFPNPEDYVANPAKGSRHNRGAAIDMTLVDKDGKELDMGTPFDDFSQRAHSTYKKLPKIVKQNRKLLHDTMREFNFTVLPTEWWHLDFDGYEKYPLLDLDFEELENNK